MTVSLTTDDLCREAGAIYNGQVQISAAYEYRGENGNRSKLSFNFIKVQDFLKDHAQILHAEKDRKNAKICGPSSLPSVRDTASTSGATATGAALYDSGGRSIEY